MRVVVSRTVIGLGLLLAPATSRAELVEDIMAWVNGDIITKSDYDAEQQLLIADAARRFTGQEREKQVEQIRKGLLLQMIDRKILVDHARRLYDMEKMTDSFYKLFKEQQDIKSDEELERMLAEEGMSVSEVKRRLVEMYAPDEVVRFEVRSRLAVGQSELETYYQQHPEEFAIDAEVTFREIVLLADTPERRAERRAEAEAIRQRIESGEEFAEVARQLSEAASREEGGLVGPMKRAHLSAELEAVAFSIPIGTVSQVLESPHGWHIIKVESRGERTIKPLEETRDPLRRLLEERKYRTELQAFLEKARADAEWCVKPRYQDLLSIPAPASCQSF